MCKFLREMPVQFECNCSHEKFLNAIKGLGGLRFKI